MKPNNKKLPWAPYEVTNKGQVKSLITGKILKPAIQQLPNNKQGYYQVWLRTTDNKRRWYKVHRLVAELYVTNYNPTTKKEVNHKDGNKLNNDYKNLEWVTHSENIQHSFKALNRQVKPPMKNKVHSQQSKQLMSKAKQGINHPKFRGYYIHNNTRYTSLKDLATALDTYTQKVYRMYKSGLIQFSPA